MAATKKNAYKVSTEQKALLDKQTRRVEVAFEKARAKAELMDETLQMLGQEMKVPDGYRYDPESGEFILDDRQAPPGPAEETIDLDSTEDDQAE
ncbi:MAG: hypothetical protein CMB80_08150 [Flammeovirgaceae bacterium]|nr:hypothetical protein [Flammeovirgaceae bacterium]|tara:strand:+ start:107 stop:388 length:282 start_codon:yes stop_codon:yes gene_type:complete